MFIDLDAEFHVLKLLFEDFVPKIIRGAGNSESLILRVKFLCLKYGGTHGRFISNIIQKVSLKLTGFLDFSVFKPITSICNLYPFIVLG